MFLGVGLLSWKTWVVCFNKVIQGSLSQFTPPPAVYVVGPPATSVGSVGTTILTGFLLACSCCCIQNARQVIYFSRLCRLRHLGSEHRQIRVLLCDSHVTVFDSSVTVLLYSHMKNRVGTPHKCLHKDTGSSRGDPILRIQSSLSIMSPITIGLGE